MSDNEQMNKKVETVADILEEMRGMGNYQRYSGDHAHALADRIEAAWKRQEQCYLDQIRDAVNMIGHERFAKEHPSVGNAAATREAFLEIETVAGEAVANGTMELPQYSKIVDIAEFALSAPARNCDRPDCARINDAAKVWYREEIESRVKESTMGHKELQLPDWLLATVD